MVTKEMEATKKKDSSSLPAKSKEKLPASSKRPTRKKPKDKPKRPLSAYNFFFKEEREKILKIVLAEDPKTVENEPDSEDFINEEMMERLKKEGGKVSFEEMGKLIGQRWKNIDSDRLSKYSELAAEDTERYKKEMQSYNGRQEAKMRSEALKPPAWNGGEADSAQVGFKGGVQDGARGLPAGYNDAMAASFANQAAAAAAMGGYGNPYAGMDLSGAYAMGGMYPGAYGYGVGAMGQEAAMQAAGPGAAAAYGRQAGGGAAAAQGMYAQQMMMGGGGFPQAAAGAMGGYGQAVEAYGGQAAAGAGAQQQYGGIPADQMAYAQGYGGAADAQAWGGQ
uniref:HMG box domain-containing protein n=1 Tax=Thalassionema nitzschioides TaxID=33649 RepID=A0A7S1H549_9STRA|mmetsp:Transcript_8615/g.7031  ORF Transcript_8615/g.7031 Transcript_8615/m.7031 type:complete len:336 (+) Transcript_8615:129-1136(+)